MQRRTVSRRLLFTVTLFSLTLAACFQWGIVIPPGAEVDTSMDLARARAAQRSGRFEDATKLAQSVLSVDPDNNKALFVAAEAETRLGNFYPAIEFYDRISADELIVDARTYAAEISRHIGDMDDAVQRFRKVLLLDSTNTIAHRRLAWIFNLHGCRHEAQQHLLELCKQQEIDIDELILLGDLEFPLEFTEGVRALIDKNPQTHGLKLGLARHEYEAGRVSAARQLLVELQTASKQIPPWMRADLATFAGRMHLDNDELDKMLEWQSEMVGEDNKHADLWCLRGELFMTLGQQKAAIDCFEYAVSLNPNGQESHYQLATAFVASGREIEAEKFFSRATRLRELHDALNLISSDTEKLKAMLTASRLCEELNRPWEAVAWQAFARMQVQAKSPPDWAMSRLAKRLPLPTVQTGQTLDAGRLCSDVEIDVDVTFSGIETPDLIEEQKSTDAALIGFRDVAQEIGMRFGYDTGLPPRLSGRPMYSFPGGGIGVIDVDLDSWPDLYLPQATTWPPDPNNTQLLDGLYRNLRGTETKDVADVAGIQNADFSHGVAVGDFDNDGFPDVYVANILKNSLYHNCGDGTFEAIEMAQFPEHGWTTSCVIADLTNDGLPDLYDVNYAQGDGIYEMVCEHEGVKGTCTPMAFEPEPDVFFINNGDGTFSNQTMAFGFGVSGGNGLGIVVADLTNDQNCEVFVANDADPNFLFSIEDDSTETRYSQVAQLAGLAVDGVGNPQACMGIALADTDGNQQLDLFVTNYYQEHNVLYSQLVKGSFVDFSRNSHLYGASFSKLGFGTQFVDANLDSWPDLFIANGHVDDFSHTGAEYAMQPQFFSNLGMGVFSEQAAGLVGPYFEAKHLGRGVASLDWNADGFPDVAVSHLDDPVAMLLNETETKNHFLKLSIHRTLGDRDGVGSTVTISTDSRTIATQIVAGSGYMASNEKMILTGVGDRNDLCTVTVSWRGAESVNYTVLPDRHWKFVEGCTVPYEVPR